MENIWEVLTKGAHNLSSHWPSYTVLSSFILYVSGYLTLRFHLAALGVGTDLSVIDERYLFAGARCLLYLISSVPSLLLLVLLLVLPIYLPFRILPLFIRVKVGGFFYKLWQSILSWWLMSNRLAILGIFFALLVIQLVMRQCFLLSNMLLTEDLYDKPLWLRNLLLDQSGVQVALYFIGLIGGALVTASIFYALRNRLNQTVGTGVLRLLLGFLLCVQLLLIPVNYGILEHDKWMPRVTGLSVPGELKANEQAWLVWEGNEGKTFLLRKHQAGRYTKSLMTIPKKEVKRVEISGYDHIYQFLFSKSPIKPAG